MVSGGRDLITPAAVADRITELLPDPTRVLLPTAAHSMLDTRQDVALRIIAEVAGGSHEKLAQQAEELDALPVGTSVRMVGTALAGAARLAAVLPPERPSRHFMKPPLLHETDCAVVQVAIPDGPKLARVRRTPTLPGDW